MIVDAAETILKDATDIRPAPIDSTSAGSPHGLAATT